jgi:release factor glutamine methyltransferase
MAWARRELRDHSESPARDASVLLSHLLGESSEYPYLHPEIVLTKEQENRYRSLVERRRNGEPVAYIRGYQEFMGLRFSVDNRVLIPRPETELLVEKVLSILGDRRETVVADVGCGSGAIGLSLAKLGGYQVVLTDSSSEALSVARFNADNLEVSSNVSFLHGDLLVPLYSRGYAGRLDALVSNPPYIPDGEMASLPKEVGFEPQSALDGGPGGLRYIRRLVEDAGNLLKDAGWLVIEIEAGQGAAVRRLLADHNWENISISPDYAGKDRIAAAMVRQRDKN